MAIAGTAKWRWEGLSIGNARHCQVALPDCQVALPDCQVAIVGTAKWRWEALPIGNARPLPSGNGRIANWRDPPPPTDGSIP